MRKGHHETNRVPGMPRKAPKPVQCEVGGKHNPNTFEKKVDGKHVKYVLCMKCWKMP